MVWASDGPNASGTATRELVLPTGTMHLVVRVSDHPLRMFDDLDDYLGNVVSTSVVGGARTVPYIRDISEPTRSVGAQLRPGASELLLGVPAGELADSHTAVDDIWRTGADSLRDRLCEAVSLDRQLTLFEAALEARLPQVRGMHPVVALALQRFARTTDVRSVVRETGCSHHRFIALFREAVGMSPKLYCQVRRFQGALERLAARPQGALSATALDAGYSDQPHFTREFHRFAEVTPGEYRRRAPKQPNHLPIE
jgi:AraC-like DNA-binding protein